MDRFITVRLVQCNALDLALFQFDYDLTFAVFFLNADKTIYGRYGTRSSVKEASRDISIAGFRKAMAGALQLHADYPANREVLEAKTGPKPRYAEPQEYPTLTKFKATLDYQNNVAGSCIHCHQIRDAERRVYRDAGRALPEQLVFPWPLPKAIGLSLDPEEIATVTEVEEDSPAAAAGFQNGDSITKLDGQPLLSVADLQWVLHNQPVEGARVAAEVVRDGRQVTLTLPLEDHWRRRSDISWRVTTWGMRRMGTGGLVLEDVNDELRRRSGLGDDDLALRVRHVGQYGDHAAAKRAGFRVGDIIVKVDGRSSPMRETDFLSYAMLEKKRGERLDVTVLRGDRRIELKLPMQ